jgi:NADH-quinone oxidoreductase subunit G
MSKLVTLQIDGRQVQAPEGTLIVNAAKLAGIDIPVFCYHPKMEPVGMCRMCLVEIGRPLRDRATGELVLEENGSPRLQFGPKLETACTTPVSEGMVVLGETDKAKAGRKDVLEFLLTSHPLDCPICDKGGECPLQNLTMDFGPGQSRFIYDNKFHLAKQVPLGELIMLDRERCIQCARCTRFQSEIVDDPVIGFFQRGRALEIVTFSEPGFDSYFSGNTTDICPVGALTTVDFRFEARPWELNHSASICPHCPVGCNTTLNTRREARSGGAKVIKRVMPRQNEAVNEIWICDKGRFAYHYTQSPARLEQPLVRRDGVLAPATWDQAIQAAAQGLRAAGQDLLTLGSGRLSNEDLFNLRMLAEGAGGKAALYAHMAGGDLVAQVGVAKGTNFADMGAESAILVVASDLEEEAPLWWLRVKQAAERGATLIVANPRPTKTDRQAKHLLRYSYGAEAETVLALLELVSAKGSVSSTSSVSSVASASSGSNGSEGQAALLPAAQAFAQAENGVVIYGSEGLGLEGSQALAQACANLLIETGHCGRPNNGLIAVWAAGNTQGAWDMGLRPLADLPSAISASKAIYIAGADPAGDDPALQQALEEASFVVVQELFLTETARLADVVLPAQAYTERDGSTTNGERRVQRFYPAVPALGLTLPDFAIMARVGVALGLDLESSSPLLAFDRLATSVADYAGLSYVKLSEVSEQWPIVGRGDLYYGGTTYENSQGLGVQLGSAAEQGANLAPGKVKKATLPKTDGLVAVPITRLYDRGQLVLPSELLASRIPQPHVRLNPVDAEQLKIDDGKAIQLLLGAAGVASAPAIARVDEQVPPGVVLAPRSMGLAVWAPTPIKLRLAAVAVMS